jgi:hypothetical protein
MLPRREAEGNRAVEERDDGVEEVEVRVGVHRQHDPIRFRINLVNNTATLARLGLRRAYTPAIAGAHQVGPGLPLLTLRVRPG